METSAVQSAKLAIVAIVGLSKDALHVYVGLSVFFIAALLLRKPLRSPIPWLAVLLAALAGEAVDAIDDIRSLGHWRMAASAHDIVNTIFWPSVVLLLARFTRIFEANRSKTAD